MLATTTQTDMHTILRHYGVTDRTLTRAEKDALDRLGYVVLPGIIDDDWLTRLRAEFERALAEGKRNGQHVHLPWLEPTFDRVYTHPRVLAAVHHVLGRPFRFGAIVGRDPAPGHGQQALHADWPHLPSAPVIFVTTLWLLDDFTPSNGPTRVVPGSHRMPNALPKSMSQPDSRHPQEKLIIASAGSVLLFNAYLLHSGTRNHSGRRRVLQCSFALRDLPGTEESRPQIPARLPPAARYLLGEDLPALPL
jgi:ectoine hydroxylase-related dioxygenase (phytanoyl-CoA dioxygenase family)